MFSGFIDTLMYGFSSTGVTIYCYFGLNFNDNTCCEVICKRIYNDNDMTTNKLPGMYFFFNYRYFPHTKSVHILLDNKLHACMKLKSKYINYNIRFLKLLLYDLK